MTTVTEIQTAVRALPDNQFGMFSSWFDNYEEERWDVQIENDQKSEPLLSLMSKAKYDFEAGKCTRI